MQNQWGGTVRRSCDVREWPSWYLPGMVNIIMKSCLLSPHANCDTGLRHCCVIHNMMPFFLIHWVTEKVFVITVWKGPILTAHKNLVVTTYDSFWEFICARNLFLCEPWTFTPNFVAFIWYSSICYQVGYLDVPVWTRLVATSLNINISRNLKSIYNLLESHSWEAGSSEWEVFLH